MLHYLLNKKFSKSNQLVGIHLYIKPDGVSRFYYVLISRKKGEISIEKTGMMEGDVEQLTSELDVDVPVYLSIDGKGILHKSISLSGSKSIVQQVIPNANPEEFIVQQFEAVENVSVVSIVRINMVQDILGNFSQFKFTVIGLTISPVKVVGILNMFEDLPSQLMTLSYQIDVDRVNQQIISYNKFELEAVPNITYTIGSQDLSSDYLLPYYHALTYYVPDNNEIDYAFIHQQKEEYVAKGTEKVSII